jgi:hypothetical protein
MQTLSDRRLRSKQAQDGQSIRVIAGLDPAIPTAVARPCLSDRDGRDNPGHDGSERLIAR